MGFVHYFHFTISRLYIYDILTCLFTISRLYIYDILTCLCVNLKHHEWKYIFVQFLNSTTELSIQFPSTSTISPMNTPLIHGHHRQQSTANDILSLTLPLDSPTTLDTTVDECLHVHDMMLIKKDEKPAYRVQT